MGWQKDRAGIEPASAPCIKAWLTTNRPILATEFSDSSQGLSRLPRSNLLPSSAKPITVAKLAFFARCWHHQQSATTG